MLAGPVAGWAAAGTCTATDFDFECHVDPAVKVAESCGAPTAEEAAAMKTREQRSKKKEGHEAVGNREE